MLSKLLFIAKTIESFALMIVSLFFEVTERLSSISSRMLFKNFLSGIHRRCVKLVRKRFQIWSPVVVGEWTLSLFESDTAIFNFPSNFMDLQFEIFVDGTSGKNQLFFL